MWQNLKSEDDDVFYEESLEYVKAKVGTDSYIVKEYEDFRKNDPAADSHTLREFLTDLLSDPENY